jgi:predicted metalloprotease with PDZ domain
MWRGGLSAPRSLFIHADRPLISENATSTLLHEVVHVILGIRAKDGHDWIAEGIAEYYSLELLHRGGAITSRRYARALEDQSDWAKDATALCGVDSKGATTALAVITFRRLDEELRRSTKGKSSLDQVVDRMTDSDSRVTLTALTEIVDSMLERPSKALHIDRLPGCSLERQRQEPG